jgi:excisionase family DNA binding protein
MTETHRLPLTEAARLLGISRRTAQRRLESGALTGAKVGARWFVDVVTEPLAEPTEPESRALDPAVALLAEVSALRSTLAEVVSDRDSLRHESALLRAKLDSAESERDYLRSALAASLTLGQSQRLLPERAASRAWWQVWRRGE